MHKFAFIMLLLIFITGCLSAPLEDNETFEAPFDSPQNDETGIGFNGKADSDLGSLNSDDDDDNDDDNNDDNDDDNDDSAPILFIYPHDGRLYAAAAHDVITPNNSNHPCPKYMGGTSQNRISTAVHDDLEARYLVLGNNETHLVLVSLDLVGWTLADVEKVMNKLESHGVDRNHIIISSTHTHEGPDTMGIWGADVFTSGRCEEYINFLVDTIVRRVTNLAGMMVPVTAFGAQTEIYEPASNYPGLIRDSRLPNITNPNLTTAQFIDDQGETIATVVNWHSHPEVRIGLRSYSADFPRWTRKKMDETFGGVCVYFSGTVGGLANPLGVEVPGRTEDGLPVMQDGQPVLYGSQSDEKLWSLGYIVAEYAIDALSMATPLGDKLIVDTMDIDLPFTNPVFIAAILFGLLEPTQEIIQNNVAYCGLYGCVRQALHHVQLGPLHIVSLPGEAYAETSIGREEMQLDFGEPWGVHTFPEIIGYREFLPAGEMMLDIGLANNEIGYITPRMDFHFPDHPDFYEEGFAISLRSETIIREAIIELIQRSGQ